MAATPGVMNIDRTLAGSEALAYASGQMLLRPFPGDGFMQLNDTAGDGLMKITTFGITGLMQATINIE